MTYHVNDTIAAIATPAAGAARGVVRFSGPEALSIAQLVFQPAAGEPSLGAVRVPHAAGGELQLPSPLGAVEAVALVWPTTRSYTRQITVELHLLGSPVLLEATLTALVAAGARLAEPGEFTLRAFLAGRLDLTQAEAVLGVIDARDPASLHTALAQLAGGLAQPLSAIRTTLLDLLAHLEAGLDFVEEDIEFISAFELQYQVAMAAEAIAELAAQMQLRGTAETLPRVVIAGWPNVGKSSLLNALAGGETALVSPVAGATRDYVAYRMVDARLSYELLDTAGVDENQVPESIEKAAQSITQQQIEQADLLLFCLDATRKPNSWERRQLAQTRNFQQVVVTKCDATESPRIDSPLLPPDALYVSSSTAYGVAELRERIVARLSRHDSETSTVAGTAARCRESLLHAAEALQQAARASEQGFGEELVAAELRLALEEIGKVAGTVYTDDVLDRIFSRFCIGK